VDRVTEAAVLELLAPRVEKPALSAGWPFVFQFLLLDAAVANGREIIACRPHPRRELLAEQIVFARERLKSRFAVAVIFVTQDVEISGPARDRQVGAPPVLDAIVFDVAPDVEAPDLVRAGAERRIEGRLVERMFGIIGAREDRQTGDEQRHVAWPVLGKTR